VEWLKVKALTSSSSTTKKKKKKRKENSQRVDGKEKCPGFGGVALRPGYWP
jgi:hypothetical protein